MFTSNYVKLQNLMFYNNATTSFVNCEGATANAYSYNAPHYFGNIGHSMKYGRCKSLAATYSASTTVISSIGYPGVYFGTGSTPATKSDYRLESPITSGLTITNPSDLVVDSDGNGKYTFIADFIVRNTTESEINIYEIGVFCPICTDMGYYNASSNVKWAMVLMERTVLDEPITIPAGESKLVTYKITFNQTLNVE